MTVTVARTLPEPLHGPTFGSYAPDEVSWLLTDLSHHDLEAPIGVRERAVQSGAAHYAESLPIEYQPTAEYHALFDEALARSASRVATAVGVVTEILLAERGDDVVLASLARAGTPVGILIRRWALARHGLDLKHYTISIVLDRGIDTVALRYLAAHHEPRSVAFVDAWTGKGMIVRQLTAAIAEFREHQFVADLAVLADPAQCASTFGTRDDYLIPSACLNSTVSGLVSRTVLNTRLIGPGQFHGAKFYSEQRAVDRSARYLDAISSQFDVVAATVSETWQHVRSGDRRATWSGWDAVRRVADEYGLPTVNLVKPGVGETTRVLLRRVPDRVLVRPDAVDDLGHVLLLAEQRGVPVEPVPDLAYACMGLIKPGGTE